MQSCFASSWGKEGINHHSLAPWFQWGPWPAISLACVCEVGQNVGQSEPRFSHSLPALSGHLDVQTLLASYLCHISKSTLCFCWVWLSVSFWRQCTIQQKSCPAPLGESFWRSWAGSTDRQQLRALHHGAAGVWPSTSCSNTKWAAWGSCSRRPLLHHLWREAGRVPALANLPPGTALGDASSLL